MANSIAELERNLKLDDNILKFQTVKLADKADPEELIKKAQTEVKPREQSLKVNDDEDGQDYYDQKKAR
jgi:ribosomal protein S6